MPYANAGGINIYYEVEGQGPPLVLAHSFRRNLNRWRQVGVVDALKNDYRLILFDARGHGKSDKPHDPAAYGNKMVGDVIAVLDDLHISKTHYFGYSMGAGVGFKAAILHPDRFTSFILGGSSPYPPKSPPATVPKQTPALPADPEVFIRSVEKMLGRPLTSDERQAELDNDFAALNADIAGWDEIPTLNDQQLSRISVPWLIFAGEQDSAYAGAKEAASHIPGAKFLSLPGNHATASPDLKIIPPIKEFLATVKTN
jgi:pimeloyl-ACP methyl ester carboxylesterase